MSNTAAVDDLQRKRKAGTGRAGRTRRKRQRKVESEGEVLSLEALNHKSECLCSDDLAAVVGQLGYVPSNLVRVAARSGNGEPTVVLLYPIKEGDEGGSRRYSGIAQPFPTIYWLTCNKLKARISDLEKAGNVFTLRERLRRDPSALEQMKAAHQEYDETRWNMLQTEEQQMLVEKKWDHALRGAGVAGLRDFTAVKCLHCHYAHFLAGGRNLVGEWVHKLLEDYVVELNSSPDDVTASDTATTSNVGGSVSGSASSSAGSVVPP